MSSAFFFPVTTNSPAVTVSGPSCLCQAGYGSLQQAAVAPVSGFSTAPAYQLSAPSTTSMRFQFSSSLETADVATVRLICTGPWALPQFHACYPTLDQTLKFQFSSSSNSYSAIDLVFNIGRHGYYATQYADRRLENVTLSPTYVPSATSRQIFAFQLVFVTVPTGPWTAQLALAAPFSVAGAEQLKAGPVLSDACTSTSTTHFSCSVLTGPTTSGAPLVFSLANVVAASYANSGSIPAPAQPTLTFIGATMERVVKEQWYVTPWAGPLIAYAVTSKDFYQYNEVVRTDIIYAGLSVKSGVIVTAGSSFVLSCGLAYELMAPASPYPSNPWSAVYTPGTSLVGASKNDTVATVTLTPPTLQTSDYFTTFGSFAVTMSHATARLYPSGFPVSCFSSVGLWSALPPALSTLGPYALRTSTRPFTATAVVSQRTSGMNSTLLIRLAFVKRIEAPSTTSFELDMACVRNSGDATLQLVSPKIVALDRPDCTLTGTWDSWTISMSCTSPFEDGDVEYVTISGLSQGVIGSTAQATLSALPGACLLFTTQHVVHGFTDVIKTAATGAIPLLPPIHAALSMSALDPTAPTAESSWWLTIMFTRLYVATESTNKQILRVVMPDTRFEFPVASSNGALTAGGTTVANVVLAASGNSVAVTLASLPSRLVCTFAIPCGVTLRLTTTTQSVAEDQDFLRFVTVYGKFGAKDSEYYATVPITAMPSTSLGLASFKNVIVTPTVVTQPASTGRQRIDVTLSYSHTPLSLVAGSEIVHIITVPDCLDLSVATVTALSGFTTRAPSVSGRVITMWPSAVASRSVKIANLYFASRINTPPHFAVLLEQRKPDIVAGMTTLVGAELAYAPAPRSLVRGLFPSPLPFARQPAPPSSVTVQSLVPEPTGSRVALTVHYKFNDGQYVIDGYVAGRAYSVRINPLASSLLATAATASIAAASFSATGGSFCRVPGSPDGVLLSSCITAGITYRSFELLVELTLPHLLVSRGLRIDLVSGERVVGETMGTFDVPMPRLPLALGVSSSVSQNTDNTPQSVTLLLSSAPGFALTSSLATQNDCRRHCAHAGARRRRSLCRVRKLIVAGAVRCRSANQ